ncbi:MAG: DUF3592 domain-containing protein [Planctomycetota bacterium]|nr:DUF3592 domain-containing protein [Planctomycetota bacterium]
MTLTLVPWTLVLGAEIATYVAVVLSSLAAAALLFAAGGFLKTWLTTRSWKRVTARVTAWDYEERLKEGKKQYVLHAKYAYEVDGARYEGSGTDDLWLDEEELRQGKDAIRSPGDEIEAYYDPKHPERAVMYRSAGGCGWALVVLALIFFALAGYCIKEAMPPAQPLPAEAPEPPSAPN